MSDTAGVLPVPILPESDKERAEAESRILHTVDWANGLLFQAQDLLRPIGADILRTCQRTDSDPGMFWPMDADQDFKSVVTQNEQLIVTVEWDCDYGKDEDEFLVPVHVVRMSREDAIQFWQKRQRDEMQAVVEAQQEEAKADHEAKVAAEQKCLRELIAKYGIPKD